MTPPDIVPLTPSRADAYLAFARRAYGPSGYQAQRSYLRWLYDDAPRNDAWSGGKLAVVGERVVGCFHFLGMPWLIDDVVRDVATPHNLFVDEEYRTGVGFALITEALRGKNDVLLCGAGAAVRPIYERLRARVVQTYSVETVVNPFTAPLAVLAEKFAPRAVDRALARAVAVLGGLRLHSAPSPRLLSDVAATLAQEAGRRGHVHWTNDLLEWRFFAPSSPRHLLVQTRDEHALAIVSVGTHRSLILARIVEWFARDDGAARALLLKLRTLLGVIGVNVLSGMTTDPATARRWRRGGFWPKRGAPGTLFLRRGLPVAELGMSFCGGAADAGFEALPLDSLS